MDNGWLDGYQIVVEVDKLNNIPTMNESEFRQGK